MELIPHQPIPLSTIHTTPKDTMNSHRVPLPLYPSQPDLTIKVGDYVRSYDFPGDVTCYMEGMVVDVDNFNGHYRIEVEKAVSNGKPSKVNPKGIVILPPMNGLQGMRGLTRGVVKIDKATGFEIGPNKRVRPKTLNYVVVVQRTGLTSDFYGPYKDFKTASEDAKAWDGTVHPVDPIYQGHR